MVRLACSARLLPKLSPPLLSNSLPIFLSPVSNPSQPPPKTASFVSILPLTQIPPLNLCSSKDQKIGTKKNTEK